MTRASVEARSTGSVDVQRRWWAQRRPPPSTSTRRVHDQINVDDQDAISGVDADVKTRRQPVTVRHHPGDPGRMYQVAGLRLGCWTEPLLTRRRTWPRGTRRRW